MKVFERLDRKNDGKIDKEELLQQFDELGCGIQPFHQRIFVTLCVGIGRARTLTTGTVRWRTSYGRRVGARLRAAFM